MFLGIKLAKKGYNLTHPQSYCKHQDATKFQYVITSACVRKEMNFITRAIYKNYTTKLIRH